MLIQTFNRLHSNQSIPTKSRLRRLRQLMRCPMDRHPTRSHIRRSLPHIHTHSHIRTHPYSSLFRSHIGLLNPFRNHTNRFRRSMTTDIPLRWLPKSKVKGSPPQVDGSL
ncbi:hypothetical protein ACJQWK_04300 [Exserohilum turcicum]